MDDVCRQGIVERIDRRLAWIFALSLVFHAAGVWALRLVDPQREREEIVVAPAPVFAPIVHAKLAEPDPNQNLNPSQNQSGPSTTRRRRRSAQGERSVDVAGAVRRMGLLKTLTSRGDDGQLVDQLKRGSAPIDSEEALARASGVATSGDGEALRGRGGEAGQQRGGSDLRAGGPSEVTVGERGAEHRVAARMDLGAVEPTGGAPDGAWLSAALRQRIGALRACWERSLHAGALAGGKLDLRLDVAASGGVADVAVEHDTVGDPTLARCVQVRIRGWHLPSVGHRFVVSFPVVLITR
jgi:hypothetical protein